MTDAIGVHTYVYDAANRLTNADGVVHTWDNRGNLLADGTFTYTYSAAGRMVRAESITATLVYTYNADGLRVAQAQSVSSVQSVDTFTWDWATGVPELLSDGESLYLIGYDTLGWQNGDGWTFALPDALGSVRQETDAASAVTAVREWSPYGEEVGGAQTGLGFTGEWFDANVGLQYLRARWYLPRDSIFVSRDPVEDEPPYQYVGGNPVNHTDPSGRQPPTPTPTPLPPSPTPPPQPVPTPPPPSPPVADIVLLAQSIHVLVFDAINPCPPLDTPVIPGFGEGGLGTIIDNGNTVLTHNHFSHALLQNADFVEFTDYWGNSTRIEMNDIDRRFPDNPGTQLLVLPGQVNLDGRSATLGDPDTLSPGDWAQVVYQDTTGQMRVRMSRVQRLGKYQNEPIVIFNNHSDNPTEILNRGDSGGGVFKEGRLVANNWYVQPSWWGIPSIFVSALLPDGL